MGYILVVEDEKDLRELVCHHLQKEGFQVEGVPDAEQGYTQIQERLPEAIVLDLMLPGMQGTELCRLLKSHEQTERIPILILTARSDEFDRLLGFEIGADDYMTKPFSPRELVARLRAVLRRAAGTRTAQRQEIYQDASLYMNFATYEVKVGNRQIPLSSVEFRILKHFVLHPHRVYSRDQILDAVWGFDTHVKPRTVDVHIQKLRMLIEKEPMAPKRIVTIRGIGYKFIPDPICTSPEEATNP
jgi:two-component system phosphate regulon response regulator PhoB